MKVIFLDIDGVLNSRAYYHARQSMADRNYNLSDDRIERFAIRELDLTPLALLRELVKKTNAKIVISSTWRIGRDPLWFRLWFSIRGVDFPKDCIIDCTTELEAIKDDDGNYIGRGMEINKWMKDNNFDGKYVILDDDSDFLPDQKPNFVQTTHKDGFLWDHYDKALKILGGEI